MDGKKIQCHFISNTHWDREWRFSARRTQHMLAYMMDMLLDILDKEPEFKHFHMDSQTMPIQDYLEVYPEKEEKLKKYIQEGKIAIGPWFCLPDEYCVGGESLVRNLLLGHQMGKKYGGISKTGYSPFGWGQISQLPQIYKGFGIGFTSFYRGLNEYMAPKSEFYWEGPDGTRIYGSRLGKRPRYNVWYILQRPVYFNQEDENNRTMSWNDGNGIFKLINKSKSTLDYQYTHPTFNYNKDNVAPRAEQTMQEQNDDWSTSHRFWSCGHDSSCPDIREIGLIKDSNEALSYADVFHSTVKAMEDGIKSEFPKDAPVLKGEMRYPFTKGSVSAVFGWILSARTDIKQDNFNTERELTSYAEPMAVFASLLGAPYPKGFIDLSYNYLLQNHGHDSIGACGRDIVYKDVTDRFRQSREISSCVMERAFMDIAGDIDLSAWKAEDVAVVVFNSAPFVRSEVVQLALELPLAWKAHSFAITDKNGNGVPYQIRQTISPNYQIIQNPNDTANVLPTEQYNIMVDIKDIPALGYKTLKVQPLYNVREKTPVTMLTDTQTMENEYISVTINSNGTFDVYDKKNKKDYKGLGYFKDTGEIGNPWEHVVPESNETLTTLNEKADITLLRQGAFETAFKVVLNWKLPEARSADEKTRSNHLVPCKIETIISLRKGQKWVEIETTVDNRSEDHYLQVAFPTRIKSEYSYAQGQFDVLKRQVAKLDYSLYDEIPMTEHPMNSFVDLTDGKVGAAILNTGLKAYEADDDANNTMYITLLRSFPLRICVTQEMQDYSKLDKDSQCLGKYTFRYAFMPHEGDWEQGEVWKASEQFNIELNVAQIAPTKYGKNELEKSFVEFKNEGLHVSAIKKSEEGDGYIVRVFNPSTKKVSNAIRLNSGISPILSAQSPLERQAAEFKLPAYSQKKWETVKLVTLEELPQKELKLNDDGFVDFEITSKKILTLEFLPSKE